MSRSDPPSFLASLAPAAQRDGAGANVRVGVVAGARGGAPLVDFPGNPDGPLPARSLVSLDARALEAAVAARHEVVLLFDGGDARRPIIAGLLQPETATPALDAALEATIEEVPETAEVDGRHVVITGHDTVVIRCGEASILLRRDGKVVIRGLHVETHAAGTNRVKGATVKIN